MHNIFCEKFYFNVQLFDDFYVQNVFFFYDKTKTFFLGCIFLKSKNLRNFLKRFRFCISFLLNCSVPSEFFRLENELYESFFVSIKT